MMKHTQHTIKTPHKAIVGLLCAFILLFGIGFGVSRVEATNPYVSNIKFSEETGTGYYVVEFFVNSSFVLDHDYPNYDVDASVVMNEVGLVPEISGWIWQYDKAGTDNPLTYTAGNTYKNYIYSARQLYRIGAGLGFNYLTSNYPLDEESHIDILGNTEYYPSWADPVNPSWVENDDIYYTQEPVLNITFPLENSEISQAFDITGSYTIPTGYNKLIAYIGVGIPYAQYSFLQNLTDPSGNIDIRVSGVPSGNYTMYFYFKGDEVENYFVESATINFSILTAIPPELPETYETPPEFYYGIDGDKYYLDFSSYDTPTALYNNLKNAIQPIFTIIGSNLTFFSSQFDQDTAKETGERTGQGILIIRTYSSNLNTFFNDLPVSEFLLFYLLLLIVVIVFRIIKNLINVIKP